MPKQQPKQHNKARMPRVIAISSGKGGVGKSSITVNLGISLAKHGAKVCVLDADTGLANANILLGLTPEYSLEHVLYGAKSVEEVMLDGPHGMKIIPGAHGISDCVALHPRQQLRLTRELARVENDFDFLLVDTAAGISSTTLDFISAAQHALIVITPEPTSLTDAFSLIKLLKRRTNRLHYHVVVNMCSGAKQAREVYHRFCAAIEKYIGIESHYLGFLLRDESMRAAVVLQNPVAMFPDDDPSCRSFLRLADTLDSATSALASHNSFSAFWHRQFRRQRLGTEQQESSTEDSKPSAEPVDHPQREVDYLSEVRSRVLLLIEQGKIDIEALKKLMQDGVDTFVRRYNVLPVDVLGLVEFLVQSPERNDLLLRDIHDRVKHWGGVARPAVNELMGDDRQQLIEDARLTHEPLVDIEPARDTGERLAAIDQERNLTAEPERGSENDTGHDNAHAGESEQTGVHSVSDEEPAVESEAHKLDPAKTQAKKAEYARTHHYDSQRFGSQSGLLEILQRRGNSDKPLSKLLESWV